MPDYPRDVHSLTPYVVDPKTPGGNPNNNPHCGRKIKISRTKGNDQHVTAEVTVVDRCKCIPGTSCLHFTNDVLSLGVGCKEFDLDVSPAVFKKLADPALGRVSVDWQWL